MYQGPPAFGHTAPVQDDDALAALCEALVADRPATHVPSAARVRRHDLGPLAHTHGVPGFRSDHAFATIQHDRLHAAAAEACAALHAAGIAVALYKGIAYAGTLYADPAERPMTDVDLLVHPADATRAIDLIQRLGYWHVGPAGQRAPRTHAITLKRRGDAIDLHRSPMQLGRAAIPFADVLARATPSARIPGALRLAPVDELLFHLAHMIRHELYVPLIGFVDVGRMLARLGDDRRAAYARADAWRLGRSVRAALEVVDHVIARGPRPRWWLPARAEVLRRTLPARPIQVARKLLLIDGPKEIKGFAASIVEGQLQRLRSRRPG